MAKSDKPLGTTIPPQPAEATLSGPSTLLGRTVSLNYKGCDYFEAPSRAFLLNHANPTFKVPLDSAQIRAEDLKALWVKLKMGHVVLGSQPMERFEKQPDVLDAHLALVRNRLPMEYVRAGVIKLVNGVEIDGGYTKLQLLEALLEAEEKNPVTGKGGFDRKDVKDFLKRAIEYVVENFGGVSRVTQEASEREPTVGDSSNRRMDAGGKADVKSILNLN